MKKKKKYQSPQQVAGEYNNELFRNEYGVASSTDFTGLMPTPALEEREVDSYKEIHNSTLHKENSLERPSESPKNP